MDNFNLSDLIDTLSDLGMQYTRKGDEYNLFQCPYCEKDRPNKSDHFSFNSINGCFNCVKCGEKGNLYTFRRDMCLDPWKNKKYRLPDQTITKKYSSQPDSYYQAYQKARYIPDWVLKKYAVGKTVYGKLGICRTYQYVDIDGQIVNVKYVNAKKEMAQEKDAKKIYYGLQFLDYSNTTLHVCEGEDDCHALVSMGLENVVSVPSGASFYNEEMGIINSKFKKIYLFFDNDKAGQEGAHKFAQKAGVWKCWNVFLPFKDARECLINGYSSFELDQLIFKAKQFKYDDTAKQRPGMSIEERIERFENETQVNEKGINFGYKIIDEITGGMRGGDLFSIVANPGCFKTTTLMNLIKRAADNTTNGIILFFSLEMQAEAECERELQIYLNENDSWKLRQEANKKSNDWQTIKTSILNSQYSRIYVSEENDLDIDGIINVIHRTEEATGQKTILVGIDYIDFISTKNDHEYDAVRTVMNNLKSKVARKLNIPVIILCQTNRNTKDSEEEVGERSGKGGTGIESASDFLLGIWRSGERVVGRMNKHRRCVYAMTANPYLSFHINKRSFHLTDICQCERPKNENW